MMGMIYSVFSLDPSDRKMLIGNFQNVGQAISDCMDIYSLRLANLARALMVDPWLLLIDELEGGMSESFLRVTMQRIREFQAQHPMPIIVTAMSDTVLEYADRVYCIAEKKLVQEQP